MVTKKISAKSELSKTPEFPLKFGSDPFKGKKKSFRLWGSWYSNQPTWTHGFNAKIGFEKYAPSPKILPKKCPKSAFQTKPAKFDTFWPISRDSVHIIQNRFLHWNREFEPLDLNTMNPIIGTIFFSHLYRRKSHFVGHFFIGKWPKCDFLSPDPCLVYTYTSFLTIGSFIFHLLCFSLRLNG